MDCLEGVLILPYLYSKYCHEFGIQSLCTLINNTVVKPYTKKPPKSISKPKGNIFREIDLLSCKKKKRLENNRKHFSSKTLFKKHDLSKCTI